MARKLEAKFFGNFIGKLPGGWEREQIPLTDIPELAHEKLSLDDPNHTPLYRNQTPYQFYDTIDRAIVYLEIPFPDIKVAIDSWKNQDHETVRHILFPLIRHLRTQGYSRYDLAA